MKTILTGLAVCLASSLVFVARADDQPVEVMRDRAATLMQEALNYSSSGRHDQALKAFHQAWALRNEAAQLASFADRQPDGPNARQRDDHDRRIEYLQRLKELAERLNNLVRGGRAEAAEEVKRQIREVMELASRNGIDQALRELDRILDRGREREAERPRGEDAESPQRRDAERTLPIRGRIEHLQQAAEHLHAAGMHDRAEEVQEHARELARELQRHGENELREQIEMLSREVRRLRDRINELEKARKKRSRHDDDDGDD